jgi:hypothetical protein
VAFHVRFRKEEEEAGEGEDEVEENTAGGSGISQNGRAKVHAVQCIWQARKFEI